MLSKIFIGPVTPEVGLRNLQKLLVKNAILGVAGRSYTVYLRDIGVSECSAVW